MSHATLPIAIKYGLYTNLACVIIGASSLRTVPGSTVLINTTRVFLSV